jgi:hypothetical protein
MINTNIIKKHQEYIMFSSKLQKDDAIEILIYLHFTTVVSIILLKIIMTNSDEICLTEQYEHELISTHKKKLISEESEINAIIENFKSIAEVK